MKKLKDETLFYILTASVSLIIIILMITGCFSLWNKSEHPEEIQESISETDTTESVSEKVSEKSETEETYVKKETEKFFGVDVIYIE